MRERRPLPIPTPYAAELAPSDTGVRSEVSLTHTPLRAGTPRGLTRFAACLPRIQNQFARKPGCEASHRSSFVSSIRG
ncbi:hypothetical protein Intca_0326 [Intrasporangium calvum DSM 43043]|uniref:Uncharacterized protein n=1 Tax=Intrasporangium calvum (strain ATCC 23552 / DSM 43043 / JCM 3097 / NBRC 12989 / NCIMB 10167 / NRRL B-3866 / 7 KIP) TaxID=710696 RepID=E6S7I4_INTC7|nr:hypothetical protein Intca_0326 [Intrasporangium calvum DSM 43043]